MDSKHFHVAHSPKKNGKTKRKLFNMCWQLFGRKAREKCRRKLLQSCRKKEKVPSGKWQVIIYACVWVDQGRSKGGSSEGAVDSADTWQHFTFIVAVEDARSEGGGMHPKVPVTGEGKKARVEPKAFPQQRASK